MKFIDDTHFEPEFGQIYYTDSIGNERLLGKVSNTSDVKEEKKMGKFAMKWARKTDVPLYHEMIDPVLTVDDGCFPSLEFIIEIKCGDCAPTISNKNVYLVINGIEVNHLKLVSVDYSPSFDGLYPIRYKATINTSDPLNIDYLVEEFKEHCIAKAQNQESIVKAYGKVKEEEMKINYGIKANANTARKFEYSDPLLNEIVKERKEEHKKEKLEKTLSAYDSYLRQNPFVNVCDLSIDIDNDDSVYTSWEWVDKHIERVKIDDPWVIMFWSDKTVTKAKCDELDSFDPEVGIMVCICKKLFRTPQNLRKILKNLTKDYYKEFEDDITFNGFKESIKKLAKFKEEMNGSDNK